MTDISVEELAGIIASIELPDGMNIVTDHGHGLHALKWTYTHTDGNHYGNSAIWELAPFTEEKVREVVAESIESVKYAKALLDAHTPEELKLRLAVNRLNEDAYAVSKLEILDRDTREQLERMAREASLSVYVALKKAVEARLESAA